MRQADEEGESVFISMTDMTVSILFIVIILLAFFASQYRNEDYVPRSELAQLIIERDALHRDLDLSRRELAELRRRLIELEADLIAARATIVDLREKLDARDSEIDSARLSIADLERQKDALLSRIEDLFRRTEEANATVLQRRTEIDRLRRDVEAMRAERNAARAEAADLRNEVQRLRQELDRLEDLVAREERRDPLEAYLAELGVERARLLERVRQAIRDAFPDLEVVMSSENDALQFQGEGLFRSDGRQIREDKRPLVDLVAETLDTLLPCYTLGDRAAFSAECNPSFAIVEAVQIEGHTDSDGGAEYNMGLSADRAFATYRAMVRHVSGLNDHRNMDGEPVLSVAGYGEGRPVADNATAEGKSANRRIDLRFIMVTPNRRADIAPIRDALEDAARNEP